MVVHSPTESDLHRFHITTTLSLQPRENVLHCCTSFLLHCKWTLVSLYTSKTRGEVNEHVKNRFGTQGTSSSSWSSLYSALGRSLALQYRTCLGYHRKLPPINPHHTHKHIIYIYFLQNRRATCAVCICMYVKIQRLYI